MELPDGVELTQFVPKEISCLDCHRMDAYRGRNIDYWKPLSQIIDAMGEASARVCDQRGEVWTL